MTKIKIENLPPNVSRQRLKDKISSLKEMSLFSEVKQITLSYLGGITNHGLKDDERNLFIRIPGENSDLLIDRDAELDTLRKLASNGLYPSIHEAYSEGALKGYKIEPFIEGETLQFDTFHLHQQDVLPSLKHLHDSGIQFANEFNIFARLNLMYETLLFNNISTVPYFIESHLSSMPIEEIKQYIDELQEKKNNLFPYEIELCPCQSNSAPPVLHKQTESNTIDTILILEQEKTDDKKIAQNNAFAKLKDRALKNEVDTYPRGVDQFFQPTPTEELVDRVLRLCQPIRK